MNTSVPLVRHLRFERGAEDEAWSYNVLERLATTSRLFPISDGRFNTHSTVDLQRFSFDPFLSRRLNLHHLPDSFGPRGARLRMLCIM